MLTSPSSLAVNTCWERTKSFLLGIALYVTLIYIVGTSVYEAILGGKAAAVVASYYDYSYPIPNSTVTIAIDALPRDVYKDTKTVAGILLSMGIAALVCSLGALCVSWCPCFPNTRAWFPNALALGFASGFMAILPFSYAAFVVWKYNSMSQADKTLWDSVDVRFMQVFSEMYKILIITAVPFGAWLVVGVIMLYVYMKSDY